VELGVERLDLLHQAVHEFLRTANRQRRDVVDRLVRIELRALPARMLQGVDEVALDAQQPEFENLEQAGRACADDNGIGLDRLAGGGRRNVRSQGGGTSMASRNLTGCTQP
jgi:hypothetical protein